MRYIQQTILGCLALFLPISEPLADTIYRWVDENGKTHFSDKPPPSNANNRETKEIKIELPPEQAADENISEADSEDHAIQIGAFDYEEPHDLPRWDEELKKLTHLHGKELEKELKYKSAIRISAPLQNIGDVKLYDVICYASYESTYQRRGKTETSVFSARPQYATQHSPESEAADAHNLLPEQRARCEAKVYFPPDGVIVFHVRWKLHTKTMYSYSTTKVLNPEDY